jgi:phenylpropionate dioxygenase-like ring-hydroxylating dioxygenase large terminal subunit
VTARDHWYVAARSDQLGRGRALARKILGRPVALYRGSDGRVAALENRCPHKNVPLSIGRVRDDRLQCRYHGWSFDRKGRVVDVPCHAPGEPLPACGIPAFPVIERDGWIWLWPGDPAARTGGPPSYPRDRDHGWFELHNVMDAPMDLVLENGLDCSHTGFVHRGLFRSDPSQLVTARIEEDASGVRVETFGERPRDTDVRVIARGGEALRHVDRLILPHTVRVDYELGRRAHIVTILVCTPEDERATRVYTRMGVRWSRGLTWPMTALIHALTRIVVAQDKRLLEAQAACIRAFGGRRFLTTVPADQPGLRLQRALRQDERGTYVPGAPSEVTYRL